MNFSYYLNYFLILFYLHNFYVKINTLTEIEFLYIKKRVEDAGGLEEILFLNENDAFLKL